MLVHALMAWSRTMREVVGLIYTVEDRQDRLEKHIFVWEVDLGESRSGTKADERECSADEYFASGCCWCSE